MAKLKKASGGATIDLDFGEPNPKQVQFFMSRKMFTAYGGAKGGGKTWAVRVKAVGMALTHEGIRILIMRRTYPELQENHISPIIKMVPPELASYNATTHVMNFINGSTIKFGHWQGEESEREYQGMEFDVIFLDEATQLSERTFQFLGGCLRGVNDFPKRMYITCNPGGIGHAWVKRLFIDKKYRTDPDNPEATENPDDYLFIPATVDDNKFLMESSPGYVRNLAQMPEDLRRAYRYGDWDAIDSGAYFSEFSEKTHTCKSFKIPDNWKRYRSFDYGLDMFACFWWAVDEDGRAWCYREYCRSGLIVQDAAQAIREHTLPGENIITTYAPPDMWNRQKDTGRTMAELFISNGIPITKSDNNRVQGHMLIKEMLAPVKLKDPYVKKMYESANKEAASIAEVTARLSENGKKAVKAGISKALGTTETELPRIPETLPGMIFFSNCKEILEDLPAIQHDENNPNDCAKEPHNVTHTVDGVRYFAINRKLPAEAVISPTSPRQKYEEWMQSQDNGGEDYDTYMCGGEPTPSYIGVG